MQFLFHENAGQKEVVLKQEAFKYLIKVRRHRVGDTLTLRCEDAPRRAYLYRLARIEAKQADLQLESSYESEPEPTNPLVVGWCVVDAKVVEKTLPMLNELGVKKVCLIWSERSQAGMKINVERFKNILKNSMQQCGRTEWMEIEESTTLSAFLELYPGCAVFDFGGEYCNAFEQLDAVLIGPEGGFSQKEREWFVSYRVFSLRPKTILRSESAVLGICAKILL